MPVHHSQPLQGVVTVWGEVRSSLLWSLRRPTFPPQAKTPGSRAIPAQSGPKRLHRQDRSSATHNTLNPRSENRGPLLNSQQETCMKNHSQ